MKRVVYYVSVLFAMTIRAAIETPAEIPGCVLWLDAADTATYDGSLVAQWRDKSGLGHHMAQGDAAKQPTVLPGALNGRNVLTFDGGDWLVGAPVLTQGSTNFSFFSVWRRATTTGGSGILFEQYGDSKARGTRCSIMAANGGSFGFTGEGVDMRIVPYAANTWALSGFEYDGRSNGNTVFWDAAGVYGGTLDNVALQIGATAVKIGASINADECLNGELAEIVVYEGELTDTQRNAVLFYLQDKWGVGAKYMDAAEMIDFSHGRLPDGWIGTGTAFSNNQPIVRFPGTTYNNAGYYIDTNRGGTSPNSDSNTGELVGNEFVISNNTLRLRVGGGYKEDLNALCQVRLERKTVEGDWEIVRKTTGAQNDPMREIRWNTHNLIGQTVRLSAVDNNTGGWGCIFFDSIRILDEPEIVGFDCGFSGAALPPYLLEHRPMGTPTVEVTSSNTLRFACSGSFNAWGTYDQAPKVLFQTFSPETFSVQTHVSAFSYEGANRSHTGLMLAYEKAGTNQYDYLLFGPFAETGKVRVERTGSGAIGNEWTGNISNVYLRVTSAMGMLTFLCSQDGTNWTTVASTAAMQDSALLNAGLFVKTYDGNVRNLNVEFTTLSYQAATTNSPTGVPGCVLWLDADDASSIVPDGGGGVLQWRDKSGFGNHVVQMNAAAQPAVTVANLNGRATLAFDGGDWLAGPPVWQQGETNFAMFAVWRRVSTSGSQVIVEQAAAGNGARAALHTRDGGTYGFCGEQNDALFISPYAANAWNLSGLEYSGLAANNLYLDADGALKVAGIDHIRQNVGVTGLRVGSKVVGGESLQGDLAEVLLFNRILTAAERYNILYYLQEKWQLGNAYYGNPDDIPARSLTVGDAQVDLHCRTETYEALTFTDGAVVTNGSLVCVGAIEVTGNAYVHGELELVDGVVVRDAQTGCVHVDGTLTFGATGSAEVLLPSGSKNIRARLFTASTIIGESNLTGWRVEGVPLSWRTEIFVENGTDVMLRAAQPGTILMIM